MTKAISILVATSAIVGCGSNSKKTVAAKPAASRSAKTQVKAAAKSAATQAAASTTATTVSFLGQNLSESWDEDVATSKLNVGYPLSVDSSTIVLESDGLYINRVCAWDNGEVDPLLINVQAKLIVSATGSESLIIDGNSISGTTFKISERKDMSIAYSDFEDDAESQTQAADCLNLGLPFEQGGEMGLALTSSMTSQLVFFSSDKSLFTFNKI